MRVLGLIFGNAPLAEDVDDDEAKLDGGGTVFQRPCDRVLAEDGCVCPSGRWRRPSPSNEPSSISCIVEIFVEGSKQPFSEADFSSAVHPGGGRLSGGRPKEPFD
eukprot:gnl/TRDRNA2_/TRDRNA2_150366_c0_seq1.p3 gnl/TRDRNA2_/TRDRNA2_150366_c0~~gnl/TRDRNA2_/TRDRNA2_150366_c0_seq1.p3  ORF type:complete len:114 (-),score=12.24 gnl/TRDRNA2_/TRDRNA2_150366_c0_seq1:89-403(-)